MHLIHQQPGITKKLQLRIPLQYRFPSVSIYNVKFYAMETQSEEYD